MLFLFFQELALTGLAAAGWIVEDDSSSYVDFMRGELRASDYVDDVAAYLSRTK